MPHQGNFLAGSFTEDLLVQHQTFKKVKMPKTHLVHTTMAHLKDWSSIKKLKSCPLCGSLNVMDNTECFACRWQGEFDSDQRLIQLRIAELALRAPELKVLWKSQPNQRSWKSKFKEAFTRFKLLIFRRKVDLTV